MLLRIIFYILIIKIIEINCHGRLIVPPARTSAWREDPVRFPVNYDDGAMFCGGTDKLWRVNKGKCGICGEDYALPKQYEKGGAMYRGFVVRKYIQGQQIEVVVDVTANHYGYFEFRICNVDSFKGDATQQCLDKLMLKDTNDQTQIYIQRGFFGKIKTTLKLPSKLTCKHCVFQWKYNGGNSWNTDPVTGQSCVGCGPQEQFYGCSDISISRSSKRECKKNFISNVPQKVIKSESMEESNKVETSDSTVTVSQNFLRRLYAELKRLKSIEDELIEYKQSNILKKLEQPNLKNENQVSEKEFNNSNSELKETERENIDVEEEQTRDTFDSAEERATSNVESGQNDALNLFFQKFNS